MTPRFPFAANLIGIALLVGAPALAQDADDAETEVEAVEVASQVYDASLKADMYRDAPIMMRGIVASQTVAFTFPTNWELTEDPELHLFLEHSESLLPDRSSMTVLVNNKAVFSTFLDSDNAARGKMIGRIPKEIVNSYNELTFMVTQHYTRDCEDPFDYSLWTRVSEESFVRLPHVRKEIKQDLAQLPGPFYDEFGLGEVDLSIVATEPVAEPTIAALGELGVSFGRMADHRQLDVRTPVRSVRQAKSHAILAGVIGSHPEIQQLLGSVPLKAGEGLVAIKPNPADPSLGVLIVTGRDHAGLMNAVRAVAGEDQSEILSGPSAIIRNAAPAVAGVKRQPLPAPRSTTFTLEDLAVADQTVRGFYSDVIKIPVMMEGDSQVRPGQASMTLRYGYSAQLDTRLSTVEIIVDGVNLASAALDDPDGSGVSPLELVIDLPAGIVKPSTSVEVKFHLFPETFDACERVSDMIIWGTVFADTEFTIKRDHYADMPNLSLLKHNLWPFTMEGERGQTMIIAPDRPSLQDAAATFLMAGQLGRYRTTTNPRIRATTAGALEDNPAENEILLVSGSSHAVYDTLRSEGLLGVSDASSSSRSVNKDGQVVMSAGGLGDIGKVEQLQNPSDLDKSVLILDAPTRSDLIRLVERVGDPNGVRQLAGNITMVPRDVTGTPKVMRTARLRLVGEKPISTRVTQALSSYWPFFGLLLLGAALLFTLVVSLWARRNGAHL